MTASEECSIFCVRTGLDKKQVTDECKSYILLEDYITNRRCIDCVNSIIGNVDMSYEAMERRQFSVWFSAIYKHRIDIVEKLIEYGAEGYSDYRHRSRYGSYTVLLSSFLLCLRGDTLLNGMILKEFLNLFLSAGIDPVDEAYDICIELNFMITNRRETYFQLAFDVLKDYGFREKEVEYTYVNGDTSICKEIAFEQEN